MPLPDGAPPAASPPTVHKRQGARTLWYLAGLLAQCLLWLLVFLALVLAVLGGEGLTEFRYVGF